MTPKRISRKPILWLALLSFLAVTKSYGMDLPNFSSLVQEEGDAVVKISVMTETSSDGNSGRTPFGFEQLPEEFRRFFEQTPQNPQGPRRGGGFGSGFITSEDGYIITNAHVVDNAVDIRVGLQDRREFNAELIGSDVDSDIAVLKINAEQLPTVRIGDSDNLTVGEWVLAIGSPFGFEHTATQGIVSALSRSLPDDTYVPFIQTDVAVNPGNSGGPLFNTDGEVVGVNSQIYSRSGGYQGLSFAIPINVAMSIADQIKDQGYATRGWLGVTIQNVDQALAESFGLNKPTGALIAQVAKGGPADVAGLNSGDIILEFNGREVFSSNALPPLVGAIRPGSTADVLILRDGEEQTVGVTIETLERDRKVAAASKAATAKKKSVLGASVADLTAEQMQQLGVDGGVVVTDVASRGAAADAGVQPGDVILSINRQPINSMQSLEDQLEQLPRGDSMPLLVHRQQAPLFMALTLPERG